MRTPSIDVAAASLSGGNQQKLIVGREMTGEPKVLIASHPTRGVDVGAQAAIWAHLRDARARGLAVLLISADLDELIGMSDTLWVILRGRLVTQVDPAHGHPGGSRGRYDRRGGGRAHEGSTQPATAARSSPRSWPLVFAGAVTSVLLFLTGHSPVTAIQQMWDYGTQPNSIASILNNATTYYIAAVAVAIGFRMNLFNIGVDGQYRLAALLAAAFAGSVALPTGLRQIATIAVAMPRRGVLGRHRRCPQGHPGRQRSHLEHHAQLRRDRHHRLPAQPSPPSGIYPRQQQPHHEDDPAVGTDWWTEPHPKLGHEGVRADSARGRCRRRVLLPDLPYQVRVRSARHWHLVDRGAGERRERRSGWCCRPCSFPEQWRGSSACRNLLGDAHQYSLDFPAGLGFTGIAIALLGRNSPIGIIFAALLWAFLDQSSLILDINDIPKGDRADHPRCGGAERCGRLRGRAPSRLLPPAAPRRASAGRASASIQRGPRERGGTGMSGTSVSLREAISQVRRQLRATGRCWLMSARSGSIPPVPVHAGGHPAGAAAQHPFRRATRGVAPRTSSPCRWSGSSPARRTSRQQARWRPR